MNKYYLEDSGGSILETPKKRYQNDRDNKSPRHYDRRVRLPLRVGVVVKVSPERMMTFDYQARYSCTAQMLATNHLIINYYF